MITSPIWLPATLVAAIFQPWRTAVQRRVGRQLSINAAGLVRYLYGLPFALAMAAAYQFLLVPAAVPVLGGWLPVYCAAGGLAQIVATNLLLMAFDHRNFVVGTAYSKTEAVQGAYLAMREPGQIAGVFRTWRISGQVGLLSSLGSACWFTGFATAPVALVRVVGQIEVAFTMSFGHFYLGERVTRGEVAGLALVTGGVVGALVGAL
ncbi:EamA family transporter [Sphingomonas sp.]|uniref:EamA family transporter n=1 Tax=Sphingomonas sp. TaxID=28214 RepID=UPI001EC001C9|nr:EamA family transporter [Sphingomonas sp.]MBX3592906.1 EamA family transporter [Sphingomonas sp.]